MVLFTTTRVIKTVEFKLLMIYTKMTSEIHALPKRGSRQADQAFSNWKKNDFLEDDKHIANTLMAVEDIHWFWLLNYEWKTQSITSTIKVKERYLSYRRPYRKHCFRYGHLVVCCLSQTIRNKEEDRGR